MTSCAVTGTKIADNDGTKRVVPTAAGPVQTVVDQIALNMESRESMKRPCEAGPITAGLGNKDPPASAELEYEEYAVAHCLTTSDTLPLGMLCARNIGEMACLRTP